LGEEFIEGHLATIGVDLATKRIVFGEDIVKFVLWDLAGQPSFKQVRGHYYHGSNGIILVYSVIDRDSFDNASKWLVEAFNNLKKLPPTIIVANKIDLRGSPLYTQQVSREEGEEFATIFTERLNVPAIFMETSAKTGENIRDAFSALLKMMEEEDANQDEPDIYRP